MNGQETPAAEGTLNKKEGSSVIAHHESTLIYFSAEKEELILLNEKLAADLDDHAKKLMVMVDEVHKANKIYSSTIEAYRKVQPYPDRVSELTLIEAKVAEAEQKLADKKEELQNRLGDFESGGTGYEEVAELIPIKTKNQQGSRQGIGSRYVYVKKSYIDNFGTGGIHRVSLRGRDRSSAQESIFNRDANGNIKSINIPKIKEQLKKIESENKGVKFFEVKDIGTLIIRFVIGLHHGTRTKITITLMYLQVLNFCVLLPTLVHPGNGIPTMEKQPLKQNTVPFSPLLPVQPLPHFTCQIVSVGL